MIAPRPQPRARAREMADGGWRRPGGRQLSSSVVGIVGCGHVGQRVAQLCAAFGARVVAHDIRSYDDLSRVRRDAGDARRAARRRRHRHGFRCARRVHARPDRRARDRADEGGVFVNTARGGIVDEAAPKSALVERRIAGAAPSTSIRLSRRSIELLALASFVGTPHIGGGTGGGGAGHGQRRHRRTGR